MKIIEHRQDCNDFDAKEYPNQTGSCETDGHYLCAGCKHIAPFDMMTEADNRRVYYPKEYDEWMSKEEEIEDTRLAP